MAAAHFYGATRGAAGVLAGHQRGNQRALHLSLNNYAAFYPANQRHISVLQCDGAALQRKWTAPDYGHRGRKLAGAVGGAITVNSFDLNI